MNSTKRIVTSLIIALPTLLSQSYIAEAATSKATPKASAKSTSKPTTKASSKPALPANPRVSPGQGGFDRRGGFDDLTAKQQSCLKKNGFTFPTRPTNMPSARPTGAPSTRPSFSPGQDGRPNFGGGNFDPAKMQEAFAACGIEFRGFGNRDRDGAPSQPGAAQPSLLPTQKATTNAKRNAFIKCMTSAGIKNSGSTLAYDQSDPDTALALIKCQKSSGFTLPKKK